jgi:hypothetical protein
LQSLRGYTNPATQLRMIRLHGQDANEQLFASRDWERACDKLNKFNQRLGLADSGDLFE